MRHNFKNIKVWQKSHRLVLEIYRASGDFPKRERYGLTAQSRRSVVSVPSNIAEGCARRSNKEFAYFLSIADGSLEETKYHLLLASDLGYLDKGDFERLSTLADEVGRMLYGFQKNLDPNSS